MPERLQNKERPYSEKRDAVCRQRESGGQGVLEWRLAKRKRLNRMKAGGKKPST